MHHTHNTPNLEAWKLFLKAHAVVVGRLEQELERERALPLTWYDVLLQLRGAPNHRMRLQDLGAKLVISKSGLTRRIDRMEAAGFVERRECAEDARGCFAELTVDGEEALRAAGPVHLEGIEEHFSKHLSQQEAEVLERAFRKILSQTSVDSPDAGGCD
ncbi:MAG: MarR family winged helix-turn-helix transcriptional regulator [Chloroflexota bacterium]